MTLRIVQRWPARRAAGREIFYTLREAEVVIESWRRHDNGVRSHASLSFGPPAAEVDLSTFTVWPAALRRPALPATRVSVPRSPASSPSEAAANR